MGVQVISSRSTNFQCICTLFNYIVKLIFSKENITIYKMYQNTTTMSNENFKIENKNKNNCIILTVQYGLNNNNNNKMQSLLARIWGNQYLYL